MNRRDIAARAAASPWEDFQSAEKLAAQQQASAPAPLGWQTRRTFRLFGLRILVQTTALQHDCPQCAGHGMWRPPYSGERVPCDLCTSAPISQASATTTAGSTPSAGSRA